MAAGCLYHRQCRSQERGNESDVYRRRVRTYGQNTGRKYSSRAPRDLNFERDRAGWMRVLKLEFVYKKSNQWTSYLLLLLYYSIYRTTQCLKKLTKV